MKKTNILKIGLLLLLIFPIAFYTYIIESAKKGDDTAILNKLPSDDTPDDWYRNDSIRKEKILAEAKQHIEKRLHLNKKTYHTDYIVENPEECDSKVSIDMGNLFADEKQHIMIRSMDQYSLIIDIYARSGQTLLKVFREEANTLTYLSDTIQDINGDGYKDLLINTYGSAGCCLKALSLIFIYQPKFHDFSKAYDFLNPTFSPDEQVIRGVCYGYMGDTDLYKYKWNGAQVDTVEYIYFEKKQAEDNTLLPQRTGKVIRAKTRFYDDHQEIIERLDAMPEEYHNIYGYDWFLGEEQ